MTPEDLRNVLRALYIFLLGEDEAVARALLVKTLEKALGEDDAADIQAKLVEALK